MFRRVLILTAATLTLLLAAAVVHADDRYGIDDCYSSGRGEGDLVFITPEGKAEGLYVQIVGLDRKPTTFILVLPGETWQVTDGQTVIASGTVDISDCDSTTTEPPEETTTTQRPPIDGCDRVECPPNGPPVPPDNPPAPSPPPDTPTTTIPGFPGTPDCPGDQVQIGTDADGNALCEARVGSG